ncbi:MAG: aspartyl/asparaginyl beta-hydroxylase domain-containing protein [Myxococcaceae bacterium]|nr:aspartyl/asparaginyl beta-hydroxylase domain-containing protein [Myxococcaceae bacterium]
MDPRQTTLARLADELEASARARHPPQELGRVAAFFDVVRGRALPPEVGPERAVNSRLYFPGLSARPWWELSELPLARGLASRFALIREEGARLLSRPWAFETHPGAWSQGRGGDTGSLRGTWLAYYLQRYFQRLPLSAEQAPVTLRSLDGAPLSREAMFSFLSPGAEIGPHSDRVNFVVTIYLPLFSSPGAWIRFGREARTWSDGVCFAADSTYFHTSVNDSPWWRGLLIVDIWHPELTPVEREVLAEAVPRVDLVLRGGQALP